MVVWVFAGGGEAEVQGLVPFLEAMFPALLFVRKTPVRRKPGPRPGCGAVSSQKPEDANASHGKTGSALARQIGKQLKIALRYEPPSDAILVIDDLDCRDPGTSCRSLFRAIDDVPGSDVIEQRHVGFAAPEIESWIIADWEETVGKHPSFRRHCEAMRHWLASEGGVSFEEPESFGTYDAVRDSCEVKLSERLRESAMVRGGERYSKGIHTPELLRKARAAIVASRCPLFRETRLFLETVEKGGVGRGQASGNP